MRFADLSNVLIGLALLALGAAAYHFPLHLLGNGDLSTAAVLSLWHVAGGAPIAGAWALVRAFRPNTGPKLQIGAIALLLAATAAGVIFLHGPEVAMRKFMFVFTVPVGALATAWFLVGAAGLLAPRNPQPSQDTQGPLPTSNV